MNVDQQQLERLCASFRMRLPLSQIEPLSTPSVLGITKYPLRLAVEHHDDPEVVKLLISRDPGALISVVCGKGIISHFRNMSAENRFSNHAEIKDLLIDCRIAYRQHRFPRRHHL